MDNHITTASYLGYFIFRIAVSVWASAGQKWVKYKERYDRVRYKERMETYLFLFLKLQFIEVKLTKF